MFLVKNQKLVSLGSSIFTSAIDITGEGWQSVGLGQYGMRLLSSGANYYVRNNLTSNKQTANLGLKGGADDAAKGSIWSATKSKTPVQNAFGHFKKYATEFPEYLNAKQYVQGAKNFLTNFPKGTLTKIRPNGDILKYNPFTNTFGVMNSSGIPKTMFRPIDGMKYWLKQ